jgi:hypothetical protein
MLALKEGKDDGGNVQYICLEDHDIQHIFYGELYPKNIVIQTP